MATLPCVRSAALVFAACVLGSTQGRGAAPDPADVGVAALLADAGARVEALFGRALSLVCTETVVMQPLDRDMGGRGLGRTVESDMHFWWDPADGDTPETGAEARRQVRLVNNRPPRDDDPRSCTTPEQERVETQPLSMLLPDQRRDYAFSAAGTARIDGRAAVMVDFKQVTPFSVDVRAVEGREDCVSYDVNGGLRGRLWIDAATHDVMRLDQHLVGMFDVPLPETLVRRPGSRSYWTLERWDVSTRFGPVTFRAPDETLVLPRSSTTLRVVHGAGVPRLRTETRYSNYQRFVTGARIVGDDPQRMNEPRE